MDFKNHKNLSSINNTSLEDIENKAPWFLDAFTENAIVSINSGNFIWHLGTWRNGIWYGDYWIQGVWKSGCWKQGIWNSGNWLSGTWKSGKWNKGYIEGEFSTKHP